MPVPKLQSEFGVGLVIFHGLQEDESEAQQKGGGQEDFQARPMAGEQGMGARS